MNKIISLATITFQLFTAFGGLFIIYIIFAVLDMNDFDLPSGIGFLIFQPAYGFIISGLTIVACIILGLPIRLIPRVYNWWSRKPVIIFIGIFIGLILLLLSLNSHFTETAKINVDGVDRTKEIPNSILVSIGWLLTAFCLLHFYPFPIIKWLRKKYGQ